MKTLFISYFIIAVLNFLLFVKSNNCTEKVSTIVLASIIWPFTWFVGIIAIILCVITVKEES